MKINPRIITRSILYALGALIGLKLYGLVMSKELPLSLYFLYGVAAFIIILIRAYFWDDFVPSLEEEEITAEESLTDIYSKRTDEELKELIASEVAAAEAKIIAREILTERKLDA